jgi:hypothetical protein
MMTGVFHFIAISLDLLLYDRTLRRPRGPVNSAARQEILATQVVGQHLLLIRAALLGLAR